jgi:hypothetical protein
VLISNSQKCYEEAMEHHHSAECSILTTIQDDMLSHNISLQQSIFKQALFRGLVRLLSLHRSEKFSKEEWAEVMSLTSKQRIGDKTSDETQEYMSTAKDLKDWTDSSLTPEEITGLIMIVRIPSQISLLFSCSSRLTCHISGKQTPSEFLSHFSTEIMPTFSIGSQKFQLVHAWILLLP